MKKTKKYGQREEPRKPKTYSADRQNRNKGDQKRQSRNTKSVTKETKMVFSRNVKSVTKEGDKKE